MKKIIEQAEARGFDLKLVGFTKEYIENELILLEREYNYDSVGIVHQGRLGESFVKYVSYYKIIFGTNFIECLVGERSVVFISRADYHRAQMSNLKTIEELIEYVRRIK